MMVLRLGMISLMAGLALVGCGREGGLDVPKSTAQAAPSTADPGAVTPATEQAAPNKPFILDGLI